MLLTKFFCVAAEFLRVDQEGAKTSSKMALVFDFDSTLISDESLVSLIHSALSSQFPQHIVKEKIEEIESITNQGIAGIIDIRTSISKRLAIGKPTLSHVEKYIADGDALATQGMRQVLAKFKEAFPNVPVIVISQGPLCIVEPLSKKLFPEAQIVKVCAVEFNFDVKSGEEAAAHEYISANDPLLNKGKSQVLRETLDAYFAENSCANQAAEQLPIVIVGDGVSDMRVRQDKVANIGIGFGVHKVIEKARQLSDFYITNRDLHQEFLPLLISLFKNGKEFKNYSSDANWSKRDTTYNFFAGPAVMPATVLQRIFNVQSLNHQQSGTSLMEYSHREKIFIDLQKQTEANIKALL